MSPSRYASAGQNLEVLAQLFEQVPTSFAFRYRLNRCMTIWGGCQFRIEIDQDRANSLGIGNIPKSGPFHRRRSLA